MTIRTAPLAPVAFGVNPLVYPPATDEDNGHIVTLDGNSVEVLCDHPDDGPLVTADWAPDGPFVVCPTCSDTLDLGRVVA